MVVFLLWCATVFHIFAQVGLQELAESVPDFDQDSISLYTNSSQDKQNEQVDNLDDSLCADEENNYLVPTKEDLTQVTGDNSVSVNNEKTENYSLVDELFDDAPIVSQSTTSSNDTASPINESFDKKIAPLFINAKKKKRFQTPVQSTTDESACKQTDSVKSIPANDATLERTKPVFTSGTKIKPSIGKKRKLSDVNKGEDEKASVKQKSADEKSIQAANNAETKETNVNMKEGAETSDNSIKKVSSTTSGEIAISIEKANKKKKQKKTTEDKENSVKKVNSCKQLDGEKTVQSGNAKTKTEKAKPVFKKPSTKSSAEKQKLSGANKDGDKKASELPVKFVTECQPTSIDGEDKEVNFNVKEIKEGTELLSSSSVKESCSMTDQHNSICTEKVNKKKRKKKATEDKEEDSGIKKIKKATGNKKEADASKKKAAQQQAKIDISCKNLDKEQRKAEKELQKISRELQKVKKQKDSKEKKVIETSKQPSDSSSSSGQLWVQCDQPDCLKWRRLRDCKNPSDIPEKWFCNMNPGECSIRIYLHNMYHYMHTDKKFNSCTVPEEDSSDLSDSQEYVYATYTPGALVWAKVTGYPWCVPLCPCVK